MATNREKFLNDLRKRMSDLCDAPPPLEGAAGEAQQWFKDIILVQPLGVNTWFGEQMDAMTVALGPGATTWSPSVGQQGRRYHQGVSDDIDELVNQRADPNWPQDKKDAYAWFRDPTNPSPAAAAPKLVVGWVKSILPPPPQPVSAAIGYVAQHSETPEAAWGEA